MPTEIAEQRKVHQSQALNEWFQTIGCRRTTWSCLFNTIVLAPVQMQEFQGPGFEMCCSDHSKDVQYLCQKSSKSYGKKKSIINFTPVETNYLANQLAWLQTVPSPQGAILYMCCGYSWGWWWGRVLLSNKLCLININLSFLLKK